ncbi:uncharacterized protein CcaverHIS019_0110570 [Cutaneotrichosporon cavernicola]|uniref:Protein ZIP4 homolog n=1 Tax=Cutaneotrichosporon cavernicola TaxID=279322 RepID=A0AA48KXJ2_9TREE|nr:uncharacterized protein CcaverHIS019_0110570 [Cutaneotrichosporon cavernicola]BEI88339.1 hypothetical protein CcaverHIS019_0110570 [Cutaneotrichosporon cavernicola]
MGNLQTVKEALNAFIKTKPLLPTSRHTSPEDRSRITEAIVALHSALDRLAPRSRKRREGSQEEKRSNWLDEEGVYLWNLALAAHGRMTPEPDSSDLLLLAHVKHAAFKFIEAATDSSVLEQKIMEASLSPDSIETQERLQALLGYYASRCEAAMEENNDSLGFIMLEKAAELVVNHDMDSESVNFPSRERLLIGELQIVAHQYWVFGNRLRESDAPEAQPSDWLQKGLELVAKAEAKGVTPGLQDLQATARVELAKSNIDNLERASVILEKLGAVSSTLDPASVQEVKILKLHMLQCQGANEGSIRLEDVIGLVQWSEDGVKGNDLQSLGRQQLLTQSVSNHAGFSFISEILLSILLSCRKLSEDFQAAHRVAAQALDKLAVAGLGIPDRTEAIACQTILWSLGETLYKATNFKQAAQWFVLGAHSAFRPGGIENFSKCRRKAVLAYINGGDAERAKEQLQECPAGEASTQYLSFLVAINTSREIAATTAIEQILNCPDLDGKQLLLMGQAAQEKGMKVALSAALNALLTAMTRGDGTGTVAVHALTLIRCLMEMNLAEIHKADDSERGSLLDTFSYHLQIGHKVIDELHQRGEAADYAKPIAWVYKTAYNAGVQAAMSWGPGLAADIFDSVSQESTALRKTNGQIMDIMQGMPEIDADVELPIQRATAMFACFTGKVEVYRRMNEGEDKGEKIGQMGIALSILESELLCEQGNWERLEQVMEIAISNNGARGRSSTLEAVVTVLAQYPQCPTRLSIKMLERLLETLSPESEDEGFKLARWTHHLVVTLLNRGTPEDTERAYHYLCQVIEVQGSDTRHVFPDEEYRWFASVAYSSGMSKFNRIEGARAKYNDMVRRYQMVQQRFARR